MLPRIEPDLTLNTYYKTYIDELSKTIFSGEICTDYAARITVSTDNSIYQVIPEAVLFPKTIEDLRVILTLGHQEEFRHHIKFAPRGGGTGTNGQSLSAGIIIDCSKYMREIIAINTEEKWVSVQPGVVLDQLNFFLQPYGFYFAPQVSTSSRATLGGMINTDACGNGSLLLGRTSDHIHSLTCILSDGSVVETDTPPKHLLESLSPLIVNNSELIKEKFRKMPRMLTGYNLFKVMQNDIDLNQLFAGSEGTLGVVAACKLNIMPIPKFKKVILVKYKSFDDALRAPELHAIKPMVIETIDTKLLSLARQDKIYYHLKDILDSENIFPEAINIVEFISDTNEDLDQQIQDFLKALEKNKNNLHCALGYYIAKNPFEEKLLWDLRKKSVGLISQEHIGNRRPIPFIEDTAVSPEHLADYIAEFKALLDSYQLIYGMYGHIDAGCIHIRPALDMQSKDDQKLIKELSDKVVLLLEKYHGVMWGEHGKGYRCEYTEQFFGEKLHLTLREIKTIFDPFNQLNPGKIVTPLYSEEKIVKLEENFRGNFDNQVATALQENFTNAMICNGNGACFNNSSQEIICPSYKVTRERIHSPKGRAVILREWLRQLSTIHFKDAKPNFFIRMFNTLFKQYDFSHEVFNAMSGCLGCKACASQCPLKVDVPELKAKFLSMYYQRYLHSSRDIAISFLEKFNAAFGKFPKVSNFLLQNTVSRNLIHTTIQLVDLPAFSYPTLKTYLKRQNAPKFEVDVLKKLSPEQKSKTIILLQDSFTSFYESLLVTKVYGFFSKAGIKVYVAPFFENGKPLQVKGFLNKFKKIAKKNIEYITKLAELDIAMIGIDPSMTLTYRDEYKKMSGLDFQVQIKLPQEWLVENLDKLRIHKVEKPSNYYLLSHCSEKSLCVAAEEQWQTVFKAYGLDLKILSAGCCGMAGSYGHEVEHVNNSIKLFRLDWEKHLLDNNNVVATGYSCRSQASRLKRKKLLHPLEVLVDS